MNSIQNQMNELKVNPMTPRVAIKPRFTINNNGQMQLIRNKQYSYNDKIK